MGKPNIALRIGLCVIIFCLTFFACFHIYFRLIAQSYVFCADNHIRKGFYGQAALELEKAVQYQPRDYKIRQTLGKAFFNLGTICLKPEGAFAFMQKAKKSYHASLCLQPINAQSAYGAAISEAGIDKIKGQINNQFNNQFDNQVIKQFEKAISLRPNSALFHHAFVRYLYQHQKKEKFLSEVSILSSIYPPAYYRLKKENFWSPFVKDAVKHGLEQAVNRGVCLRETHKAISSISAEDGKLSNAILHYEKAMTYSSFKNSSSEYFHLGYLYLKNRRLEDAEKKFFKGLDKSRFVERDLNRLLRYYRQTEYLQKLPFFLKKIERHYTFFPEMDILTARSLIELKQFNQARQILENHNTLSPSPKAYYWLASIARTQKDWDRMELAIQKATMLDPANSRYHQVFADALNRQKKRESAEKEAGLAIKYSKKPCPWLFNQRAWIRWSKKNYKGALSDWQKAVSLKPDRASFHAHAAEACLKMNKIKKYHNMAEAFYQKAMELDPKNKHYKKKYLKLKETQ